MTEGRVATGIDGVEARDSAKHPTAHWTASAAKIIWLKMSGVPMSDQTLRNLGYEGLSDLPTAM